ncbi:MAG: MoxR family ATPase [Clostridia bacterium]|nr:MoxR family ATPase [Clostridia bacterium]
MLEHIDKAQAVLNEVNKAILGKEREIVEIMTAFLANGHVLLEDIPGVGKTTLATAFSAAMGLDCKRVQFTPDVMPSDLTGFSVYRRDKDKFVYQPGSVFCNLLLADEINRTSPKTQSALLEVMEERKVSVEGITREVPSPFLVIATQNPSGTSGTQFLPEAQIDRFMITMSLGYPDFASELEIARSVGKTPRTAAVRPVLSAETLVEMQDDIHNIYIKDEVYTYLLNLVSATRNHPLIERGASPRATISLVKMAKASAWLRGRKFVVPTDIQTQLPFVLTHRIILNSAAKMGNTDKSDVIQNIISSVELPYMGAKK